MEEHQIHDYGILSAGIKVIADGDKVFLPQVTKQLNLRKEYAGINKNIKEEIERSVLQNEFNKFEIKNGVYCILENEDTVIDMKIPAYDVFQKHLQELWEFCTGPAQSFCDKRLSLLVKAYELHKILFADLENDDLMYDPVDFYSVKKVDNHIHAAAMVTGNQLLKFMKKKIKETEEWDLVEPVLSSLEKENPNSNQDQKMAQVNIEDLENLFKNDREAFVAACDKALKNLTVDSLKTQGNERVFNRFDNFNKSYEPCGNRDLRDIFLKPRKVQSSDVLKQGKFFREILWDVLDRNEKNEDNVFLEPRLSIHGTSENDWKDLAEWWLGETAVTDCDGKNICKSLKHKTNAKWLVQVARVFGTKGSPIIETFQKFLVNFFNPLFEVTLHPPDKPEEDPLTIFLENVVGFDTVGDESPFDELIDSSHTPPEEWVWSRERPPYSYYAYYMYANIQALNYVRQAKGLNTFAFRPHTGEAGQVHHLATAFLLADSINHGIMLVNNKPLMYLYYLAQIGISLSPLSNNALYLPIAQSPFETYHAIGHNVTLSTDDPLQFHFTNEPLIEEYVVASKVFKLSTTDLAEIAGRSVLQSGWDEGWKSGIPDYNDFSAKQNVQAVSNIPNRRADFRYDCLQVERNLLSEAKPANEPALKKSEDPPLPLPKPNSTDKDDTAPCKADPWWTQKTQTEEVISQAKRNSQPTVIMQHTEWPWERTSQKEDAHRISKSQPKNNVPTNTLGLQTLSAQQGPRSFSAPHLNAKEEVYEERPRTFWLRKSEDRTKAEQQGWNQQREEGQL